MAYAAAKSSSSRAPRVTGEETTNLRLSLRIGGTITGELYGADGTLAVNATVQVIRPTDYSTQITSTDEEGFFRVERLEPGNWQVIGLPNLLGAISGEENQGGRGEMLKGMQMAFVELEDAEEEHVILGEPPADPVLLSGSVTHLGEPVKDAALVMILEGKGGFPKIGSTDDQGRYELKLDEPGEYLLTVQRTLGGDYTEQHQCSFNLKVPKVAEHRHDVELPGGEVRGRVTFDSGEPAAGVPVTLSPDYSGGYNVLSEQTNTVTSTREDGSFSIDGVTAGGYHLRAGGVSHIQRMLSSAPNAGHLFGQDELHLVIAKAQLIDDVRLVLPLAGSIAVHVVDVAGAPVQGASIFIRSEDGRQTEALSAASTNTNGVCNYEGLSEGTYQVSARTSDQASSEGQRVRVLAGETASVELKLDSGTMLRVVTVDGEGAPLASNLRVIDSEGRDHASYPAISALQAMMATEGLSRSTQSFGPLPPGPAYVCCVTSGFSCPVSSRITAESSAH